MGKYFARAKDLADRTSQAILRRHEAPVVRRESFRRSLAEWREMKERAIAILKDDPDHLIRPPLSGEGLFALFTLSPSYITTAVGILAASAIIEQFRKLQLRKLGDQF
ncbi:hypothetical protein HY988_06005 [Candidatus Micrarchaeota archaeon]|nr:hypothetical protein [Candidatus Micrarchaeota archaeon]